MEYRLKYRDIPWGVALTVLPGKIIGKFIIVPVEYVILKRRRLLRILLITMITSVVIFMALTFVDMMTDRKLFAFIGKIYENILALL